MLLNGFDVLLERRASCPRIETLDAYAKENPPAGMQHSLQWLEAREVATIARWLEAGAPRRR